MRKGGNPALNSWSSTVNATHLSRPPSSRINPAFGLSRRTQVVDIGANPIDGEPPYQNLLKEGLADIVGFEPQIDALEKLNAQKSEHETYLPYAIGDGLTKTLYLTGRTRHDEYPAT